MVTVWHSTAVEISKHRSRGIYILTRVTQAVVLRMDFRRTGEKYKKKDYHAGTISQVKYKNKTIYHAVTISQVRMIWLGLR